MCVNGINKQDATGNWLSGNKHFSTIPPFLCLPTFWLFFNILISSADNSYFHFTPYTFSLAFLSFFLFVVLYIKPAASSSPYYFSILLPPYTHNFFSHPLYLHFIFLYIIHGTEFQDSYLEIQVFFPRK